ncbi:hypothetical protein A3J41_02510 [candidate division TM6 bacterium RIFCSPHIGHO2_12_FULL_38_8]|nr:MAG: hypothetical protein A3J41_02510 [candidate division TM6 bacterium RIFCSPHIGHO2_12_FULL_38_8]
MQKIIVIGASAASIGFITKLRSFDQQSQIICFSGESFLPYNRCLLADFLTGEQNCEQLQLKPQDFFQKNNVDLRLNAWVTRIDAGNKKVLVEMDPRLPPTHLAMADSDALCPPKLLSEGWKNEGKVKFSVDCEIKTQAWYPYDYLFLGMGTRPVTPKFMQNLKLQGLFNFHTLQDMYHIKNFIADHQPKTAVVIGAGLNGIEAASSLVDLGLSVTVIEACDTILPGQVDDQVADWICERMQVAGVRVLTGSCVVELGQKDGNIASVHLNNGSIIPTSMVVVAVGSRVNSDLLHDSGIALSDRSVLADRHLRTNLEGILAGGDVCAVPDMISGALVRSTTWSDAMLQGLCAATNLSATPRAYPGMLGLRDSYFFGLYFYGCGLTVRHDSDVQMVLKIDGQSLKKFFLRGEQLIGFVLLGDVSGLAEYKMWYATCQKVQKLDF